MNKKKHLKTNVKIFLVVLLVICIVIVGVLIYKNTTKTDSNEQSPVVTSEDTTDTSTKMPDTFLNKVSNESGYDIKDGWQDMIVKYMDAYYKSMYTLELQDMSSLFTDPNGNEAYLTNKATELLIKHHAMQTSDMHLTAAKYDIDYKNITINGNNVIIKFLENDYMNFKYLGNIESKAYDVSNTIVLKKTNDTYTIDSIRIIQGYYIMFTNEVDMTSKTAKTTIDNLENKYLATMTAEVETNKELIDEANKNKYTPTKTFEHAYNRDKALEYANTYVNKRNSAFTAYDESGGNCQNFASQCINAGGIPMDYKGEQWKHYSSSLNTSEEAKGRSASFISTTSFYNYAKTNTGYGLVSDPDVNIFYGEAGDIAHVGYKGYSHAVVVVSQVKDKSGKTIDLLINCNTVSLENYPLLGYVYPNKRLIKILGYND